MTGCLMSLERDLESNPSLAWARGGSLEELRQQLLSAHNYLMSGSPSLFGYLYQQQVLRNRELKERLETYETKREHNSPSRR